MLLLDKKVNDLTTDEMLAILRQLLEDGYLEEGIPMKIPGRFLPNDMVKCVLEIVDHEDIDIVQDAFALNVTAVPLGTICPNGFDEWSFEGIDANMRRWYNEWYCGGSPESHNGYNFDILGIDS